MIKIVEKQNEGIKVKWEQFVKNHPNGNFFQTHGFVDFAANRQHYNPVTLFALSENELIGVLCGVIQKNGQGIKGYLSSRLIIWGAPLTKNNNAKHAEFLIKELIKKYKDKTIYIEFRNLFSQKYLHAVFQKQKFQYLPYVNFIVKTDNNANVKKRISKSKIRQIKSSLKKGCRIIEADNIDDVKAFYKILQHLYNEKVKKPLPDFSFFKIFYKTKNLGKILLIKKDAQILGGIVCPIFENKVIYEWYICGADGREKGVYPSVLATYAPIEYALKNGLKYFDFMGAGRIDTDYGVREFKSKFGGELVEYGRYKCINKPLLYKVGELGLKILGKLNRL